MHRYLQRKYNMKPSFMVFYLFDRKKRPYNKVPSIFFFYQQKTDIIDREKVPRCTQEVDKRKQTDKKQKPENYLLPNQVRNSTTEFVLFSLNTLAQAHKLVTKIVLIFCSMVPSFSKPSLFLARHRVQNMHRGAASQILLRFLPAAAPCQAKRV